MKGKRLIYSAALIWLSLLMSGCMFDVGTSAFSLCPENTDIPSLVVNTGGGSASCMR